MYPVRRQGKRRPDIFDLHLGSIRSQERVHRQLDFFGHEFCDIRIIFPVTEYDCHGRDGIGAREIWLKKVCGLVYDTNGVS